MKKHKLSGEETSQLLDTLIAGVKIRWISKWFGVKSNTLYQYKMYRWPLFFWNE